ncbi:hypothetical protein V2G26_002277 [Clonostachys chloroleuca]
MQTSHDSRSLQHTLLVKSKAERLHVNTDGNSSRYQAVLRGNNQLAGVMVFIFLASYRTELLVQPTEELGKGWRLSTRFGKLHHLQNQLVDAAMPTRKFADKRFQTDPEDETARVGQTLGVLRLPWVYPLAFVFSGLFVIPVDLLVGVTGYSTDLDFLFSIIGGYAVPGDPILGHYNKIPPRLMVASQLVATVVSVIASLGIINFQLTGMPGICNPKLQPRWICGNVAQSWTTSIIWGALGPSRLFGSDALYRKLPWAILAGALWPVAWYLARQRWPNSFFRFCHPLVLLVGPILWAPFNLSMVWQGLPVSFVFGYWIKHRYVEWWNKYNYVTSTALLSGIAFSIIIQFAGLTNQEISFPEWWGTTKYMETCDFQDCRWLTVNPGEAIGPAEWH